jgi:ATPase subunit of ABC transporter with duplicated ATPase domains
LESGISSTYKKEILPKMKAFATENIRNLAVIGHGDAGKTQLISSLLHLAGATNRWGRVDDGTTVPIMTKIQSIEKFPSILISRISNIKIQKSTSSIRPVTPLSFRTRVRLCALPTARSSWLTA